VEVLERELAAVRAQVEGITRESTAHAEGRAAAERELATTRDALTTERSERTKAESRVRELETRVPAPRSGSDLAPASQTPARSEDPFDGVISRAVNRG
jgi:chromosome segregation ATPase